jgi:hypothetical protein
MSRTPLGGNMFAVTKIPPRLPLARNPPLKRGITTMFFKKTEILRAKNVVARVSNSTGILTLEQAGMKSQR